MWEKYRKAREREKREGGGSEGKWRRRGKVGEEEKGGKGEEWWEKKGPNLGQERLLNCPIGKLEKKREEAEKVIDKSFL